MPRSNRGSVLGPRRFCGQVPCYTWPAAALPPLKQVHVSCGAAGGQWLYWSALRPPTCPTAGAGSVRGGGRQERGRGEEEECAAPAPDRCPSGGRRLSVPLSPRGRRAARPIPDDLCDFSRAWFFSVGEPGDLAPRGVFKDPVPGRRPCRETLSGLPSPSERASRPSGPLLKLPEWERRCLSVGRRAVERPSENGSDR